MRAKHTPVPWTFDRVWGLIKGPNGEEIAAIHPGTGDGERQRPEVALANAQLMVQAPNLFFAAEEMLGYLSSNPHSARWRKVLAKACGQ